MVRPDELRDLWQAELREEAARLHTERPEPWFEIEYTAWMLAHETIPVIDAAPEKTWVWSDLHLSDPTIIQAWKRPFRNGDHMNRELLGAWRRHLNDDDMIICLGDVAHPDFWRERRNLIELSACPGSVC